MPRLMNAILCGLLILLLLPVAFVPNLRAAYFNAVAIRRCAVARPDVVLLGDSHISKGGIWGWRLAWDPFSAIVVAQPGATLRQIAGLAIEDYRPKTYLVEAGTNDVLLGLRDRHAFIRDYVELVRTLEARRARVVVSLLPPNRSAEKTAEIDAVNRELKPALLEAGAKVVDMAPFMERDGHAAADATTDGVHLSERAYEAWARALRAKLS